MPENTKYFLTRCTEKKGIPHLPPLIEELEEAGIGSPRDPLSDILLLKFTQRGTHVVGCSKRVVRSICNREYFETEKLSSYPLGEYYRKRRGNNQAEDKKMTGYNFRTGPRNCVFLKIVDFDSSFLLYTSFPRNRENNLLRIADLLSSY